MWCCPRWCTADSNPIEVFNEAEKLASLRHPCVMAFYGIVTNPGSCATVAEYICHGSLRSGLQKIKKKVRSSNQKRGQSYGVVALHQAGSDSGHGLSALPPHILGCGTALILLQVMARRVT